MPSVGVVVARGGLGGDVGGVGRDHQEPGPACLPVFYVGLSHAGEVVRVMLSGSVDAHHFTLVVDLESPSGFLLLGTALIADPAVPPRGHVGGGIFVGAVLVEELAHKTRVVARLAQPRRHRGLFEAELLEALEAALWGQVVPKPVVVGVLAAQDGGPRRAAQGGGCIGAVEGGAALDEAGAYVGHLGDRSRVLVVGEDEQDVGTYMRLKGA